MDEELQCPLCLELLDDTDRQGQLCECNYKICLFCHNRLTEEANASGEPARCPGCRSEYDHERIRKQQLDPNLLEDPKKRVRKEEKKKAAPLTGKARKELANMRVVQRNLVYVVGLAMDICYEDVLKSQEHFGQFGRVVKISVSRAGPYGTPGAKNGPTGSAYITFKRDEDARKCIEATHGVDWQGKMIKACYGTTKYCNAFLKGVPCNNPDCLYLHDVAEWEDSYTKEETKSAKFVSLVHAASIAKQGGAQPVSLPGGLTRAAPPATASHATMDRGSQAHGLDELNADAFDTPLFEDTPESWPSLGVATTVGSAPSWAAKSLANGSTTARPPPPPDVDTQEWPELSKAPSTSGQQQPSTALETAEPAPVPNGLVKTLQRKGSTMAEQLARAASLPKGAKPAKQKEAPPVTNKLTLLVASGSARPAPKVVSPSAVNPISTANEAASKPSGAESSQRNGELPKASSATSLSKPWETKPLVAPVQTPQANPTPADHSALPDPMRADPEPGVHSQTVESTGGAPHGAVANGLGPLAETRDATSVPARAGAAKVGPPPGFPAPIKKPGPPPGFAEPTPGSVSEANGSTQHSPYQSSGSDGEGRLLRSSQGKEVAPGGVAGTNEEVERAGHGQLNNHIVQSLQVEAPVPPSSPGPMVPTQDPVVPAPVQRGRAAPAPVAPPQNSSFFNSASSQQVLPRSGPLGPSPLAPSSAAPGPAPKPNGALSFSQWLAPAPPAQESRDKGYNPLVHGFNGVRLNSQGPQSRLVGPPFTSQAAGSFGFQGMPDQRQQAHHGHPLAGQLAGQDLLRLVNGGGAGKLGNLVQPLTTRQEAQFQGHYSHASNRILDAAIIGHRAAQLGQHNQRLGNVPQYQNAYYDAGMSANLQYMQQQPGMDMRNMQFPSYMSAEDNLRAQLAGMYADRGPLHNGMQGR